jgi:xanthine dehydrogenase YagS FAD-binding subunit
VREFAYDRPNDIRAAVSAVASDPEARYVAGGTNLVDLMRLGVERPATLVDVAAAVGRDISATEAGGLRIEAGATNSELAAHLAVRRDYPVISQALLAGASGQLRNRATVGGNLLQRTRCVYFTDVSKPCNKRIPGSGCPARSGAHLDLGVLGTSELCIATHPSDLAVALALVDARVHVSGPSEDRVLSLDEFYRLPGDDPSRDTTLGHSDLVTAVVLPPPTALTRSSMYRKARDRASYAFALCSVAAAVRLEHGAVAEIALAFGGLAPRPWRATEAERRLVGARLDAAAILAAMDAELAVADPLPKNEFKLTLARRMAVSALAAASGLPLDIPERVRAAQGTAPQ